MGLFGEIKRSWRSVGVLAAVTAGTVMLSAGAVGAAPTHRAAPTAMSAAGSYHYFDSIGDANESLTLKADGTLVFDSGCTGIWVQSGSAIAMDINANCLANTWIFSGVVGSQGLSSKKHEGHFIERGTASRSGKWYAVKT